MRVRAEAGDVKAQFNLAAMYHFRVPQNYVEALKWYRKATEQGLAEAQSNLGMMYYHGEGVPKDMAEATKWYRKAAEQGDADAMEWLKKNAKEKSE